jgi:hypothetical protein
MNARALSHQPKESTTHSKESNGETKAHGNRIFLFDNPRSCSQVFRRIFQNHPQLEHILHPYASPSWFGPKRVQLTFRHNEAAEKKQLEWGSLYPERNKSTYEDASRRMLLETQEIEKGVSISVNIFLQSQR